MEMSFTLILVIITCGISLWALNDDKVMAKLIFDPIAVTERKEYYRFLTSGFVHANFIHLGFNMMSFYSFGQFLEKVIFTDVKVFGGAGVTMYLVLYLTAIIASEIPSYLQHKHDRHYLSLGASGAVSAIIFAVIVFYPNMPMGLFFIPMPGYVFCFVFLILSTYLDRNMPMQINHKAHIFGALFGAMFVFITVGPFGDMNLIENFIRQFQSGSGNLLPLY